MKILVVTNLYPPGALGGYEIGCSHAVDALRRAGHDVLVLTSPSSLSGEGRPAHVRSSLHLAGVYNPHVFQQLPPAASRHVLASSNFVDAGNVHALAAAVEDFDPDVAYLWNLFGLGGLGLVACLSYSGIPWVWHLMDAIPLFLCSPTAPDIAARNAIPALTAAFGDLLRGRWIVCSHRTRDEIAASGIELLDVVEIVPNWVTGTRSAPRSEFVPGGRLRILNAGQLGQHKGTDILIDTAAELQDRGLANFVIDIVGIGDDSFFRTQALERGVSELVQFRPPAAPDELIELYEDHDIFAFPTWSREPFGFAPLEAGARGCLPLISAECGIAEWLVDRVHCVKSLRTARAYADHIAAILAGVIPLEQLARRAQTAIWTDFHIDTILPRIEASLAEAAADSSGRRRGAPIEFYAIARLAEGLVGAIVHDAAAA